LDADGSGALSEQEFTKGMQLLSPGLTDEQAAQIFAFIDKDGDKSITVDEFATAVLLMTQQQQQQ
jgi:Ca2+-binding EF-hand superfamily protein